MLCNTVERNKYGGSQGGERVILYAVYSEDPEDPNFSYSEATPGATLDLTINNPDALGFFVEGQEYDILMAPKGEADG